MKNKHATLVFILLLTFLVCSCSPTKDEWLSKVPNSQTVKITNFISCKKEDLFNAVGMPSQTQLLDDKIYLYWDCSDGQIQIVCYATSYNVGDMVVGNINYN